MKVTSLLVFACLGAAWAQQPAAPGGAPTGMPAPKMPELADETVVAILGDGTKFTMGDFKRVFAALPPPNQQMALRNRGEFLHQWEMMRRLMKMAEAAKLDQE